MLTVRSLNTRIAPLAPTLNVSSRKCPQMHSNGDCKGLAASAASSSLIDVYRVRRIEAHQRMKSLRPRYLVPRLPWLAGTHPRPPAERFCAVYGVQKSIGRPVWGSVRARHHL